MILSQRAGLRQDLSLRIPGRYATLGVEENGKRIEQPYSILSAASEDELEFFFELVPDGALTPLLHKMQPGDQSLMPKIPRGRFSLEMQNGGQYGRLPLRASRDDRAQQGNPKAAGIHG